MLASSSSPKDLVERVEKLVLDMLPRRASSQVLAAAVGASVNDLSLAFRAVRGASLYTALLQLRLDAAHRLLKADPSLPAAIVALRCGFGHFGVFHRSYRLRFKHEPGHAAQALEAEGASDANGPSR